MSLRCCPCFCCCSAGSAGSVYRGACKIDPADPLLGAAIKVTHFGLHQAAGSSLADGFQHKLAGLPAGTPEAENSCHRPGRDVVAAPYFDGQEVSRTWPQAMLLQIQPCLLNGYS
jgi:hypothetical protein